jgi:hypothetical protein
MILTKALNKFFNKLESNKELNENQIIGIIFKVKFSDGSIKSISTLRKGTINNKVKFSTLFKHLLNIRTENYNEDKAIAIIFSYHIYSPEYQINDIDNDLLLISEEQKALKEQNKELIKYKEDSENKIKYMNPLRIFKLPLSFAGSHQFHLDFKRLNVNTSEDLIKDDHRIKYLIEFNSLSPTEVEIIISIQEDPSIVIYKFKDKLILLPKLNNSEIIFERIILSKSKEKYLIDYFNKQILLIKKLNVNKSKGFMKPLKLDPGLVKEDLNKFITYDIEAITDLDLLEKNNKETYFDPIMISAYDFYHKEMYCEVLNPKWKESKNITPSTLIGENLLDHERFDRKERLRILQNFFLKFISQKYHKFTLYAHNFSTFDGILVLESLVYLCEENGFKLEPIIKENKIISIKIRFGLTSQDRYRYYIEFHDSLLILLTSLDKLSKTFLKDHPEIQKISNKTTLSYLLYEKERVSISNSRFIRELQLYCERDSLCLAYIINLFSLIIFEDYKINVHKYPTISSLSLAIYLTHYLESENTIPLVSGEIYRDIAKAYHGGHTDVYQLYSNEKVHSYDFTSMYPTQMFNQLMPVGKITKFIGNPLLTGETMESLKDKLAFIKCSVYVDKSINRPVYQTLVNINGELRSVCATGTFLNQWVFVPELMEYEKLTNGLIKIIPNSIQMGYLFEKKMLFKEFITQLFRLKNSVAKKHPLYQITKLIMNSLSGRMGLRQELTEYKFMNKLDIEKFTLNKDVTIQDIIEFSGSLKSLVATLKDSDQVTLKSSVAIAAAITAYARMTMAPILLDNSLDILYIDTDSFKSTDKITELDRYKYLNHSNLGALKYEYTLKESIFLAPKVYGGIFDDTELEFSKVKGFKNKIEFELLKNILLNKKSIKLNQDKWFKDFIKEEIRIKEQEYTLALNENKRIIDFETFETKPYHFNNYDPENENK